MSRFVCGGRGAVSCCRPVVALARQPLARVLVRCTHRQGQASPQLPCLETQGANQKPVLALGIAAVCMGVGPGRRARKGDRCHRRWLQRPSVTCAVVASVAALAAQPPWGPASGPGDPIMNPTLLFAQLRGGPAARRRFHPQWLA